MHKKIFNFIFLGLVFSKICYGSSAKNQLIDHLKAKYNIENSPTGILVLKKITLPFLRAYRDEVKKSSFRFSIGKHRFLFKKIPSDNRRPVVFHEIRTLCKKKIKKKGNLYSLKDIYKFLNKRSSYNKDQSLYKILNSPNFFSSNSTLTLEKFRKKLEKESCLGNFLEKFCGESWINENKKNFSLLLLNPGNSGGSSSLLAHKKLTFTTNGKVLLQTFFGKPDRVERFAINYS